ncbi:MAG: DUF4189 domain-containing protein, partial [Bosea sp. (in: a-proteobacteria)]
PPPNSKHDLPDELTEADIETEVQASRKLLAPGLKLGFITGLAVAVLAAGVLLAAYFDVIEIEGVSSTGSAYALAVDGANAEVFGTGYSIFSLKSASASAEQVCRERGGVRCSIEIKLKHRGCAAYARSRGSRFVSGSSQSDTRLSARVAAMDVCAIRAKDCFVETDYCIQ